MAAKIQYGGYKNCIISFNRFTMSQKHAVDVKNNVVGVSESISNIKLKTRIQDGRQNPIWRLSLLHNQFQLVTECHRNVILVSRIMFWNEGINFRLKISNLRWPTKSKMAAINISYLVSIAS